MFFLISKVVGFFLEPINLVALALLLGLVLCSTRRALAGRWIKAGASIVFLVMCFSPLSTLLLRVLEDRFPHPKADMPAPAGIIVLGGSINEPLSLARDEISIESAATRLTAGIALSRRFPAARLIFTGGAADLGQREPPEADGVKRLWASLGVAADTMAFEKKSRNTFENATMTRDMLRDDPTLPAPDRDWLLVTSAWHMPRSMGIFRRAGFNVKAYPVDYRTFGSNRDWDPPLNAVVALERFDLAAHEWTGLLAYWLTGKTDSLFPAP